MREGERGRERSLFPSLSPPFSLRQSSVNLEQPHGSCVRSLDFNPNKPQNFASCGDDCTVKFWDARKSDQPLLVQRNHSHWSVLHPMYGVCVFLR